jgi:hypothetical protein
VLIKLLVFFLAFFGGLSAGARGLGFGFLLACITLGVGFILLRLALFDEVVATGQGSANLFDLALDTLNGALDRSLWSALLIPHGSTSLLVVTELALIGCESAQSAGPPVHSSVKRSKKPSCAVAAFEIRAGFSFEATLFGAVSRLADQRPQIPASQASAGQTHSAKPDRFRLVKARVW